SNCLKNFKENPESCHALSFSHPAELLPHQNCENLSLSLKNSVIKKGIDDCPALIDNEALVNTARIYSFFKQPQKSADFPFSCAFNDSKIFSDLVEPESIRSAWDLKICFENKALRTQECHASLWGTNPESLLSEEKILGKIVSRMLGSSEPIKCEIVESSSFNPLLLEYRTGCFALYDKKNCTATFCPKKIINNQKEISGIKYQGNIHFDYLPTNLKTEQYSIQSLLHKKLLLKSKEITNFSELKFIFSGNKKTLVHGVGCAEDLLPFHFKRDALGGCKAMPFIISGIVEQGEKAQGIILHTSIESLAMPRIVHFQYLFSAVKNYQDIHPLTLWSLYALE
ncbi:MAG: hypothetical protein KBD63_02025, partial [Bacteriovoracaceae bacterium]|nr:hypothetical protein [Bacteriovoracaceae bacterium]